MWAVILVFVVATTGLNLPTCSGTRNAVLECAQQLFDLDHNGIITPAEVAVALQTTFSFVPDYLTWQFVMRCDLNEDGVLTIEDWQFIPPNATCLPTQNCLNIACSICAQNGFVERKRDSPVAPAPLPTRPPNAGPIHREVVPGAAELARQKLLYMMKKGETKPVP
jgi:hypothetical protein